MRRSLFYRYAICLAVLNFTLLNASSIIGQSLFVNEFMASNASSIADENGEFEDWIEIYNSGGTDVDLANYYISDDPANITLWQIPATNASLTTVPAGGYLILWADKDTDDGENHVNIKLGGGGESVVLTDPDGVTIINDITFGPQTDDISYGRETDGAANFVFFNPSSPGAVNMASGPPTYTVNLTIPINADDDDGEEFNGGGVTLNSSDIEMVQDGSLIITPAFRFNGLAIPSDAVITNAYLQFYAEEVHTSAANIDIHAEASSNAAPLAATSNNISSRTTTSASANWVPAPWPTIDANGVDQQTPDLSALIQEVIGAPGWQAGNSMVFIMSGSGTRTTYSHNLNSSRAAVLHIEAEVPLPTNPIDQVFINELSAFATPYLDETGKREDWIEIYNPNSNPVSLGGLYLTDDFDNLDKWQITGSIDVPAGGYTTFFADEDLLEGPLHADFKLKAGGEEVALVQLLATGLTIIDSVSYDGTPFLATYGRTTDGAVTWQLFGGTTPNASNNGDFGYLPEPVVSLASGVYTGSQTVTLSHIETGVDIYYTLDGDLPDATSTLYTGAITLSANTSLRAIAVKSGFADSQVAEAGYMINDTRNMPVLYLTTDPDNFFDDEIGIYVDGTNGVVGYCSSVPVNWAQDWERPVNLKMFMPDGTVAFDVNAGVEISGACSRGNAMKSLAINLRDKVYGDDKLDFEVFPQRNYDEHQRFKIRNSGQDYFRLGFRDMLNQTLLFKDVDIEAQAGRSVILYINGEFWGLHNMREKYSGEHFEEAYGVKEKNLDIIKSPGLPWREIKKGFDTDYLALFNFVENGDLTVQADYDYFETQVDVNEFTNYWIAMTYMANYDWPANNLTIWRDRVNQSKWRYGVADTDGSTNNFLSNSANPDYNTFLQINDANSTGWPNHSNSTLFLRKLLDRTEYRDEFIQRACTFMEVLFPEERTHPLIDSISGLFQPNLQDHLDNWAFDNAMGGDEPSWNTWIDKYKTFWEDRPPFMRDHMNDFYGLSGYYDLTVNFDANTEGDVFVNSNTMEIPFNYTGTYFKDIPLRLTAVADPGYQFSHWLETGSTDASYDYVGTGNATLTPIFVPEGDIIILTCSGNINETVSGSATSTIVTWTAPTGTTTCATGQVTITQTAGLPSGSSFPIGTTTVSYEATDDCGTVETCTFDVIVTLDNGNLSFNCPANISINAAPGSTSTNVSWTEPLPTTTCPLGNPVATQTSTPVNGGLFPLGTSTVTYEAIDDCGNVVNCSFTVTVTANNGALSLTCPADISINALPGATDATVSWTEPVPTTTCGAGGATANQTSTPTNGMAFPIGTSSITYEATDNCGNVETCSFLVIVNSTPSTITLNCPANITVTAPAGSTGETVSWTAPIGTSDCTVGSVTTTQTAGDPSGSFFPIGTYVITYESVDGCGTTETCSFNIKVQDGSGTLTLACPADQLYVLPVGANSVMVNWSLPTVSTTCGGGQGNPNCGTVPAGFTTLGSLGDSEYFLSNGKTPWTTAQANCETFEGNLIAIGSAAENQFLDDNIDVIIHIGYNDINTEGTFEWINGEPVGYTNVTGSPDNTDANDYGYWAPWSGKWNLYSDLVYKYYVMELDCAGGSSINLTQTGGPSNGSNLTVGTYSVTYEASDDCGDVQTCSFAIEVQNNPQTVDITCPSDITVTETAGSGGAAVSWTAPTGSTTCSTGGVMVTQTGGMSSGSIFPIGTHLISYEASDACNSTATCDFTIIVEADSPPTEYCESMGTAPWQHWISNVSFNTIDNTSGKSQYSDFTGLSTNVDPNASYTFSLTPGFSWTQWDSYVRVWIDYNGDFDFTDAGEQVAEFIVAGGSGGSPFPTGSTSVTIPNNSQGTTRMRVSMQRDAYAEPCDVFTFGEVEDYTVIITSSIDDFEAGNSEVLFFNAMKDVGVARLNWVTNTDYKNDYFEVEHSTDGNNFEVLESIESIYGSAEPRTYFYTDERPVIGLNYYRVNQIEMDGSIRQSQIGKVMIDIDSDVFVVFPNPVKDHLYVNLKSFEGMQALIEIYNAQGQKMEGQVIESLSDELVYFNTSSYVSGIYTVTVKVEGRKRMSSLVMLNRLY